MRILILPDPAPPSGVTVWVLVEQQGQVGQHCEHQGSEDGGHSRSSLVHMLINLLIEQNCLQEGVGDGGGPEYEHQGGEAHEDSLDVASEPGRGRNQPD